MERNVTILRGDPTIIPIASMSLEPQGVEEMMDWVESHRPECLPDREEGQLKRWDQLFPHDLHESYETNGVMNSRALTSNELLVELAGRKCYDSFGLKAGKKSNAEYIKHTQGGDIPHACYDEHTDVLTISGWKKWADVDEGEWLATRAPDGELVYQRALAITRSEYAGKMYRVEGAAVDLLVTPNHRMYVCLTSTREGRKREEFECIEAEKLDVRSHCYVKDAEWREGEKSTPAVRDMFALLGFAIGDGTAKRGQQVQFHLKKLRKISWLRATVTRLGWKLTENAHNAYAVSVPEEFQSLFWGIYAENGEKEIPCELWHKWDQPALQALLDGLIQSDGHVSRTNVNYSSTSTRLLDQIQQLALHVGTCAHLHVNKKQCPHVNFIRRGVRPEFNRGSVLPRTSWEEYKGTVYCAQVPNGTLFVRRNGIPVWCGNSIMYHAKMTFFFAGISRRVSHELIRNYVGADRDEEGSPSQESTRFTHHYGFFIEPPKYDSNMNGARPDVNTTQAHRIKMQNLFKGSMQSAYNNYLQAIGEEVAEFERVHEKKPTTIDKKRIYEAASSFLPHQAETSFIWTTNPAAIAKLVRERANNAADLEIQRFARKLRRVAVSRGPNLFPQPWMQEET